MNKLKFRLLVYIMSFSLVGIILVQFYLINSSYKNNDEQFKYHVKQVIGNVAEKIQQREATEFYRRYNQLKDSIGENPKKHELRHFLYVQKNSINNEQIIYSNTLILEDYNLRGTLFDKNADSIRIKNFISRRKKEFYNKNSVDKSSKVHENYPDEIIEGSKNLDVLDRAQFEIYFKDIVSLKFIGDRISTVDLRNILSSELKQYGVTAPFEFGIYNNGLASKIKSENFVYKDNSTYGIPVFTDNEGKSRYHLYVTFPNKSKYLFSSLLGITLVSILFTVVIITAYFSAINQLIKQKQISEIKTDFINNMTHEFKTPIATINLALDAIKSPSIIDDKEKVMRYLTMIREENKRMHTQVENVLRISKLEKNEIDVSKEVFDVHTIIENALEHVNLILQNREGDARLHLEATESEVLLNEENFTSVIVNILENAIKYSADKPQIDVYTENSGRFILIKIKDQGIGMSKVAQKRVFEKFYREHTGDLHNVKGHGLGLSYVQQIVEDHKGQVFVESEKGKGSTFTIKIPLIS